MPDVAGFLERRLGLTLSGAGLAVFAVAGWILGRILGSAAMFLIAYGAVIVLGVAWILGRRRLAVDADRSQLPTRVRETQLVEVELVLTANRAVSNVILEEGLHHQLGVPVRVPVASLPAGQEVRHPYAFSPKLRGEYEVGPLVATWSDPFGLTRRRLVLVDAVQIIVHPQVELVHDRVLSREWEDPPIRPPFSKPWPTGFEFYGMRDYAPGDDPRRIIWRATARTLDPTTGAGRYLVREAEQGITDRVSLVLDNDREHHDRRDEHGVSSSFELAVRTVASLGVKHAADGFAVTAHASDATLAESLRGSRARINLLDRLARVDLADDSLSGALQRLLVNPRRETHQVIVTPYLDRDATTRLQLMIERGVSVMIVLILGDDPDLGMVHRAGALGASVVEVRPGDALEGTFRKVVGAGIRRSS